jgi:hypothetical protein
MTDLRTMDALPGLMVADSGEALRDKLGKRMDYAPDNLEPAKSGQDLLESASSVQQYLLEHERRSELRSDIGSELRTWSSRILERAKVSCHINLRRFHRTLPTLRIQG